MPAQAITCVIRKLRRAVLHHDGTERTDAQLLTAFLARDESAFDLLLQRHGGMVLGVCRRVLGNAPDADDAFQATFLVLLRKAASLRQRELLGNWLYGVAYRTALEAKAARARRRAKEAAMGNRPRPADADDPWSELRPLVDRELERLPDKYRVPIVLCDLEGKTRKEAARQLGCPEGTVSGRLARARSLLARRLARHGVALSAGALAAALSHSTASAEVSRDLALSTYKTITAVSAGAASAPAAALAQGVLTTMLLRKLKIVATCFLLVAIAGLFAVQGLGEPSDDRGAGIAGRPAIRQSAAALVAAQEAQKAKRKPQLYLFANLDVKRAGDEEAKRVSGIIAVDAETGKWRKITGAGNSPRISPDGETVIFMRVAGQANSGFVDTELWNCDTGGSDNPGKISDLGGTASWSPDGKHIVVCKNKLEGKSWTAQTWRIDANGHNAKELPIPKTDEVDDWSPDGKWFVTVSDRHPPHGHGYQLYLMHPDGSGELRLTKDGLNCYPRFSPDSKRIVYAHQTAKEGNSVWVVDIDGKNAHKIIAEEDLVSPDFACWSPDGKSLAVTRFKWEQDEKGVRFGGKADPDYHLLIMDADGKNRRRVELQDAKIRWLGHGEWR
jgi:RNA polymerase sigma factor (sigma-70 family)